MAASIFQNKSIGIKWTKSAFKTFVLCSFAFTIATETTTALVEREKNMKKVWFLICLVMLVSIIALVSCSDEKEDPVKDNKAIGEWYADYITQRFTFVVKADGTCKLTNVEAGYPPITLEGTWTASSTTEGTAKLGEAGTVLNLSFKVTDNKMALTDKYDTIELERVVK